MQTHILPHVDFSSLEGTWSSNKPTFKDLLISKANVFHMIVVWQNGMKKTELSVPKSLFIKEMMMQ